jgi:osmotically-inducible protein OsmY
MGGATTVATSAGEERGLGGVISDTEIKTKIQYEWHVHKPELVNTIDIVVRQGRVLLTGIVDKPQSQIEAVRLAWKVAGIKEIIDETTVGQGESFTDYAKDSWITTQLKSKLLVDDNVRSLNYTLQTVGGVVYLMGIAQNKQELDRVIEYARHIRGVKKVTCYVTIKSQPLQSSSPQSPELNSPLKEQPLPPQDAPMAASSKESPVTQEPLPEQSLEAQSPSTSPSQEAIETDPLDAPNTGSSFQ